MSLHSGADLLALGELDPKLWVALSCPAQGMELDGKTLALIDTDGDGRIRIPELLAAVRWAAARLKDPGDLLKGASALPLDAIDPAKPDGKSVLEAARQLLVNLDRPDATTLTPEETESATSALWTKHGSDPAVAVLSGKTAAAFAAIVAVRAKVDDYFARCRLAAFDARALPALNRSEADFAAIAAKDLTAEAAEVRSLPLGTIAAERPLPLSEGANPAWAAALAALQRDAVAPVLGAGVTTLTPADWSALTGKFAAYEAWLAAKADAAVSADVDRLARYYRDMRTLLHNFVNFSDFYSPDRPAVFQAGTLYLDSRSCELCIRVEDPAAHAVLATNSRLCLAYAECRRPGSPPMKIAAAFTQGDSDYLFVGRNGVFYDRAGRDWDATLTKIIENPISVRQAFFSPYKRVARFVGDQFAKFAAARDKSSTDNLIQGITTPAPGAAPAPAPAAVAPAPAFDIAKFAGIFAAMGLAVAALGARRRPSPPVSSSWRPGRCRSSSSPSCWSFPAPPCCLPPSSSASGTSAPFLRPAAGR